MDQINDPLFLKSLLGCHRMKKHAKNQVRQNKLFYKQLVKVFTWKNEIRLQLSEKTGQQQSQIVDYQYDRYPPVKEEVKPMIKIEPEISYSFESQNLQNQNQQPPIEQQNQLQQLIETPPPPPPSSSSMASSMSFSDNQATVMSASSGSTFYTPPTSAGSVSICGSISMNNGVSSIGGNSNSSGSSCSISSPCNLNATLMNSCYSSESAGSCSSHSCEILYSPPARNTPTNGRKSNKRCGKKPNVELIRRKLWLMIVRKELPSAHISKTSLREQKLIKAKSVAHSCAEYIDVFRRLNGHDEEEIQEVQETLGIQEVQTVPEVPEIQEVQEIQQELQEEEGGHANFMLGLYPEILSIE
jgi:hypothetical protein